MHKNKHVPLSERDESDLEQKIGTSLYLMHIAKNDRSIILSCV